MISENEILKSLPALLSANSRIAVPPGDDCAVIDMNSSMQLLAAADQLIENIHFLPETPPEAAGAKLMKRNLSDIAAMGGTPLAALCCIAVNGKDNEYVKAFLAGAAKEGEKYNVSVCGGDTASSTAPGVAASLTILGEVPAGKAVLRSGAKPGERLYVTGKIGNSFYSEHHLTFTPRLAEGVFLRDKVSAMMDISDGLLMDLERMAEASQVSFALDIPSIPLRPGAELPQALSDGEDYELLFTSSLPEDQLRRSDLAPITCIGRVLPESEHPVVDSNKQIIVTEKKGYEHQ